MKFKVFLPFSQESTFLIPVLNQMIPLDIATCFIVNGFNVQDSSSPGCESVVGWLVSLREPGVKCPCSCIWRQLAASKRRFHSSNYTA